MKTFRQGGKSWSGFSRSASLTLEVFPNFCGVTTVTDRSHLSVCVTAIQLNYRSNTAFDAMDLQSVTVQAQSLGLYSRYSYFLKISGYKIQNL